MTMEGTLEVRAIENGTVIDHIPANSLFKIIKILGLDTETHRITFGMNLESKRMGTKAIIKINERFCQQEEINRIAIVAPMAAEHHQELRCSRKTGRRSTRDDRRFRAVRQPQMHHQHGTGAHFVYRHPRR